MVVHVRYNSWYILLPSSAKKGVKWPTSKSSGEREPRRLTFYIIISSLSPCPGFSFENVLSVKNQVTDVRVSKFEFNPPFPRSRTATGT